LEKLTCRRARALQTRFDAPGDSVGGESGVDRHDLLYRFPGYEAEHVKPKVPLPEKKINMTTNAMLISRQTLT